jgi:hypothetical protein
VAGQAGRQHAVEHVDAEGHRVDDRERIADPHQITGARLRQFSHRCGQRRDRDGTGLAHGQPADGVAVEVHGRRLGGKLGSQLRRTAALDDPEQALI